METVLLVSVLNAGKWNKDMMGKIMGNNFQEGHDYYLVHACFG